MNGWQRLLGWLRGTPKTPTLTLDSPDLVVIAASFNVAEAASSALARATAWRQDEAAVLRHYLRLPEDQVALARELLAQDQWQLDPLPADLSWPDSTSTPTQLIAVRVQTLDALHCAQEDSRMAGLGARLGGEHLGWDALQPS